MRTKSGMKAVIWLTVLLMAAPIQLMAQDQAPEAPRFTQEQLDQLLAPIALYPDTLLSQILMASTYPLEVVEADRWVKQNQGLTGDGLDEALKDKPWDVSVKSLCVYPRVLATMSENLAETDDLGSAFLSQQDQVMDTIQKLRATAKAQGHLVSSDRQRVVVEDEDIIIEPPAPDVIYVPAYDPCWVYGPWWHPTCGRPWFWYPDLVVGAGFFFGPRIFVGGFGGWCGFHWRSHGIFVNVDRTRPFHRFGVTRMHGGQETWRHDSFHRRGVAYRDQATARRFGRAERPGVDARRAFRGFAPEQGRFEQRGPERPGVGAPQSQTPRAGAPQSGTPGTPQFERRGPEGPGSRRGFEQRGPQGLSPGMTQQGRPGMASPPSEPREGSTFQGFGRSGNEVRQQSERGRESMGGSLRGFGGGAQQRSFGSPAEGAQQRSFGSPSGGAQQRSFGSPSGGAQRGGFTGGGPGGGGRGAGGGGRGGGHNR